MVPEGNIMMRHLPGLAQKWINMYKTRVHSYARCLTNLRIRNWNERLSNWCICCSPMADTRDKWTFAQPSPSWAGQVRVLTWQVTTHRASKWSKRARQELRFPSRLSPRSHTPFISFYPPFRSVAIRCKRGLTTQGQKSQEVWVMGTIGDWPLVWQKNERLGWGKRKHSNSQKTENPTQQGAEKSQDDTVQQA